MSSINAEEHLNLMSVSMKTRCHSSSSSGDGCETKKASRRTIFTPKQLYYLEEKFLENHFPDADQREAIASHVGLTTQHVQVS